MELENAGQIIRDMDAKNIASQSFKEFAGEPAPTSTGGSPKMDPELSAVTIEAGKAKMAAEVRESIEGMQALAGGKEIRQVVNQAAGEKPTQQQVMLAREDGRLVGASFEEQYRLARIYCASGLLPSHFNTPEKIFTALQFAYELGIKPVTGLRQICIINGTPSLWGDLPLSLCYAGGKVAYFEEWLIDAKGERICPEAKNLDADPTGAVCKARRKDTGISREAFFTKKDAERAKLWGKSGPWSLYTSRMLQMKARSRCLKDLFPDVLNGISIAEYDYDVIPEDNGERPVNTTGAARLNEKFGKREPDTFAAEGKAIDG
jgi:hypothetical protein